MEYRICVTGHRPNKLFGYDINSKEYVPMRKKMRAFIQDVLNRTGCDTLFCWSGMALGVDTIFAEEVLALGGKCKLLTAIPFAGQESKWPSSSQEHYVDIIDQAHENHIVCSGGYAAWKLNKRNEYMVDRSDEVLAIYDGVSSGGTKNCIDYARGLGKKVTILKP